MYILKNNIKHEIEIKKSRFICNLIKVNDKNEVENHLKNIKDEYKGSRHNCYAYIIDGLEKASDDKEPQGTAGIPMLNLLKQKELDNVLAVVTRYFGGIKLGTGGLFKAYTTVLKEAIDEAELILKEEKFLFEIKFSYDLQKTVDYLLKDVEFLNKTFNDQITYKFISKIDIEDTLILNKIEILSKKITV